MSLQCEKQFILFMFTNDIHHHLGLQNITKLEICSEAWVPYMYVYTLDGDLCAGIYCINAGNAS